MTHHPRPPPHGWEPKSLPHGREQHVSKFIHECYQMFLRILCSNKLDAGKEGKEACLLNDCSDPSHVHCEFLAGWSPRRG